MAKKRPHQPHRCRNEPFVLTSSDGGQAIYAPIAPVKGRVHILPAPGTVIRRLKAEADDQANDDCEGKRAKTD